MMVTRRTPLKRRLSRRINDEAIRCWKAGDFRGLHAALNLAPFERSPLRVDPDNPPDPESTYIIDGSWQTAVDLRNELLELAGEPGEAAAK